MVHWELIWDKHCERNTQEINVTCDCNIYHRNCVKTIIIGHCIDFMETNLIGLITSPKNFDACTKWEKAINNYWSCGVSPYFTIMFEYMFKTILHDYIVYLHFLCQQNATLIYSNQT